MNSSSNSSGKRPMEGLNNAANSFDSGGELGGDDMSMKSVNNCNDETTQKFTHSSNSEMVREDRDNNSNYCDDIQDQSSCNDDSSDDDEEDLSEIVDLQKALEYLVSERDIEKIYNGIISTSHSSNAEQQQSDKEKNTNNDDEQLNMIPNLVNRILMECYSQQPLTTNQNNNDTSCAQKDITRKQRHKLTQLLLAVIVEFAEPYFVKVAKYKDQERARKIQQQKKQKMEMKADAEMNKKQSAQPKEDNTSPSLEFDERAISWATSCIKQLIEYPGSSISSSSSGLDSLFGDDDNADENDQQMSLEDHHIPELDALLAATGKHDAMEMEQDFQRAILQGLQSRLLHMGIG